jgi:hypothetical protein
MLLLSSRACTAATVCHIRCVLFWINRGDHEVPDPFAYFGDKNETWTKRLIAVAFVSAMTFLAALFY